MKCGEFIAVKDINGAYRVRYIAQCGGRFMSISYTFDHLNGQMLSDWRQVVSDLVALTVPAGLPERALTVESTATGIYHCWRLLMPLSSKAMADVLGEDPVQIGAHLQDLGLRSP